MSSMSKNQVLTTYTKNLKVNFLAPPQNLKVKTTWLSLKWTIIEFMGYSSVAFGVFMARCEILLLESSNYLGNILKFSGHEPSFECIKRSYINKSDLED